MCSNDLEVQVAAATGEPLAVIVAMGFSLLVPTPCPMGRRAAQLGCRRGHERERRTKRPRTLRLTSQPPLKFIPNEGGNDRA